MSRTCLNLGHTFDFKSEVGFGIIQIILLKNCPVASRCVTKLYFLQAAGNATSKELLHRFTLSIVVSIYNDIISGTVKKILSQISFWMILCW